MKFKLLFLCVSFGSSFAASQKDHHATDLAKEHSKYDQRSLPLGGHNQPIPNHSHHSSASKHQGHGPAGKQQNIHDLRSKKHSIGHHLNTDIKHHRIDSSSPRKEIFPKHNTHKSGDHHDGNGPARKHHIKKQSQLPHPSKYDNVESPHQGHNLRVIKPYRFHKTHDIPVYDEKIEVHRKKSKHHKKHLKTNKKKFMNKKHANHDQCKKQNKLSHKRDRDMRKKTFKNHQFYGKQKGHLDTFHKSFEHEKIRNMKNKSPTVHRKPVLDNEFPQEHRKGHWRQAVRQQPRGHQAGRQHPPNRTHADKRGHHKGQKNWCLKRRQCPLVLKPVCGSNGRTYTNRCQLRLVACKNGHFKSITIKHRGACKKQMAHQRHQILM